MSSCSRVLRRAAAGLLAAAILPGVSQATVTYVLRSESVDFTYVSDGFLAADRIVAPADLQSCASAVGACANAIELLADTTATMMGDGFDTNDAIVVHASGFTETYYFDNGALGKAGAYGPDYGRLTVSESPTGPAAPVPEPEAWTLMIAGFLGAGAALRRRRTLSPQI